jgi:hypothetical protein
MRMLHVTSPRMMGSRSRLVNFMAEDRAAERGTQFMLRWI